MDARLLPAREALAGLATDAVRRVVVTGLAVTGDPGARLMLPAARRDPYAAYARIRAAGPFARSRMGWYSARHEVVATVLRSPAFGHDFGSAPHLRDGGFERRRGDDLVDPIGPDSLLGLDPPEHTRLRRLVSAGFTPRSVAALRPRVEEIATGLLRDLDGPVVDVMPRFASVLPVLVICEVLGVPTAERERFTVWGDKLAVTLDGTASSRAQREGQAALRELQGWFEALFDERRRDPGDDLVSRLLAVSEDGDVLSARELMATCLLLLAAGFETTVNLLGNGTKALLAHPEQVALLREEPERLPDAVEEMLRYDAPVQLTARIAVRDVEVSGEAVPRGTPVITLLGGANRDPEVFDRPDAFDVTRPNARQHLSFALGVHHCLGAALARLEGEVGFAALLAAFPDLTAAGPARQRSTFVLRGPSSVPVRGPRVPVG
jgi:cytochrome P450